MTTHFVTLIQCAERGQAAAGQPRTDRRFVPRSALRELASRWLRGFRSRPAASDEQRLAA